MSSRLARSAGVIGIATMTSRILGVVREAVLAAYFGAGTQMDAYNVAFRIPNLVRDLFAEGAMTAAFVPTFARRLARQGRDDAWRLGNLVINALLVATGVVVVAGMVFAGPITSLFAPEFADVPGKLPLTANLTRAMLPFLTTVAVAVAMMGMLNTLHRFFVPALSPAMFNVATILCTVALVPLMPRVGLPPIAAVAIGTLLGGVAQVALQWPVLRREGFRYRPTLTFADPDLREILRLMGPGTLGLAAVQINVAVNTYLATSQEEGAVSWLSYAFRLMYLPIGLFGVSIATAALPDVARKAAAGDLPAVKRAVAGAVRMMLMLNVPATVGLLALASPIVSLLLERHRFTPADTAATATALMLYAPGLLGYSAVKIMSPTFYSLGDSRTPVVISVASMAVNLAVNLALVRVMGYRGLALGTTLAALFNAGALLWALDRRVGGLERARTAIAFVKISLASVVMGAVSMLVAHGMVAVLPGESTVVRAVRVATAIGAGLAVLVAAARALRMAEFDEARARILNRLSARTEMMPLPTGRSRLHPTILLMACAHMMIDGYSNIYAPLLPILIPRLDMSLAAAGTLTMLFQIAASVAQVGFGHLADRWRPRVLIMLGPVVAVAGLSLVGVATSPAMLAVILMVGGLGGAAFHPPAAALAHRLGGDRQGLAMSVYISGGSLGFSLGPLLFAPFAERFGIEWTPLLALPGLAVIAFFLSRVPPIPHHASSRGGFGALRPYAKPLSLLYAIVVLRTLTSLGFATFMPVMLTRRGMSVTEAGMAVSLFLFASGIGGFSGGPAADRYGPRKVIALSLVLACPFLVAAPLLTGWPFMVALAVGGFFLQSTLPVNVTFGQSIAPVSAATVSSLMMGFAWGTGGLSVPIVGLIADRIGIEHTLAGLSLIPLVAAACALPLPERAHLAKRPEASALGVPEPRG